MKSAIYNEVALVCSPRSSSAGRSNGPARARRPSWATRRPATTSPRPSWRSTATASSSACGSRRSPLSAPIRRPARNAFVANLGTLAGVYRTPAMHVDVTAVFTHTNPMRPYRGNGRPEAGYVIERMVDEAADELGIDPVELRRRNMIPPEAMPFKSGLTFTYDCGEFEKNLDMALRARRCRRLRSAPRRSAPARQAARHRPLQHDRARRGGRLRGGRDPLRPQRHGNLAVGLDHPGPGPRDDLQAAAVRPARHRSRPGALRAGRHRQGGNRRRHRRLALGGARRLGGSSGDREDRRQGEGDRRRICSAPMPARSISPTASSTAPRSNRSADDRRDREGVAQPAEPARRHGAGPDRGRHLHAQGAEFPEWLPCLRDWRSTRRPARSRSCATASSTMSAR